MPPPTRPGRHFAVVVAIALLATLAAMSPIELESGLRLLAGDRFDGVLETSLLQHWANVLAGHERWPSPIFFFPHRDTLGFNDAYFLYGVVYTGFRALRLDPFLSSELVDQVMRAVGFVGAYLFLRRLPRLGRWWSLLGAVLFSETLSFDHIQSHAQLLTVGLGPWLALLAARVLRMLAAGRRGAALLAGVGAALLLGAWLMTAVYPAWLLGLYTLLMLLLLPAVGGVGTLRRGARLLIAGWPVTLATVATLVVACLPFLWLYGRAAHLTGGHPYEEVRYYLTRPPDLLNFGQGNLLFGWLGRWLAERYPAWFPVVGEHEIGPPPLLLLAGLVGGVVCWRGRSTLRAPIAAAVLLLLLSLSIPHNVSPWLLVFAVVPGASAVRVVVRALLFLEGPLVLFAVAGLADLFRSPARRTATARAAAILAGVLLALGGLDRGKGVYLQHDTELRRLQAALPVPKECPVFFATFGREGPTTDPAAAVYSHNVEAMLISEVSGVPTINGMDTFVPEDWTFSQIYKGDFRTRVRAYLVENDIRRICWIDLVTMYWDRQPDLALPSFPVTVGRTYHTGTGEAGSPMLVTGWWGAEPWGTWSRPTAALTLRPEPPVGGPMRLTLRAGSFPSAGRTTMPVQLLLGGRTIATWSVPEDQTVLTATLPPPGPSGTYDLRIVVAGATTPHIMTGSVDTRLLGLSLKAFRLDADVGGKESGR